MAYGMLINLKKCIGCHACAVACKEAHGTPPAVTRSHVKREFEGTYPNVRKTAVPMLCNHCETTPCIEACAVEGATYKRDDGIVVIDKEKCIGCKACVAACPYGSRLHRECGRLLRIRPQRVRAGGVPLDAPGHCRQVHILCRAY